MLRLGVGRRQQVVVRQLVAKQTGLQKDRSQETQVAMNRDPGSGEVWKATACTPLSWGRERSLAGTGATLQP